MVCNYCGASLDAVSAPVTPSMLGIAPTGIAVLGWVQEIMGALSAAIGLIGLGAGAVFAATALFLLGLVFFAAGVALFYLGYALRRARPWAWKFDMVTLFIILAGTTAFNLVSFSVYDLLLMLVVTIFILYLMTPQVRDFFKALEPL